MDRQIAGDEWRVVARRHHRFRAVSARHDLFPALVPEEACGLFCGLKVPSLWPVADDRIVPTMASLVVRKFS